MTPFSRVVRPALTAAVGLAWWAASAPAAFYRLPDAPGQLRFAFEGSLQGSTWERDSPNGALTGLHVLDATQASSPISERLTVPLSTTWIAHPPGTRLVVDGSWLEGTTLPAPEGLASDEFLGRLREDVASPIEAGEATWLRDVWATPVRFLPIEPKADGRFSYLEHATFTARLTSSGSGVAWPPKAGASFGGSTRPSDPYDAVYRALLLDPEAIEDARRPRALIVSQRRGGGDSFASTDQPWIRLRIDHEDVYAVRGADLEELGVDLLSVDPLTLRLFTSDHQPAPDWQPVGDADSWMQEVAIRVEDGGDGAFARDDRIVFVGLGPDGFLRQYGRPDTPTERYTRDPFEETGVYWLSWGGSFESGPPRRMESRASDGGAGPFATTVVDRVHLEDDRTGDLWDPRPKEIGIQWERFWWRSFSGSATNTDFTQTITLPGQVAAEPVVVRMRLWGQNDVFSRMSPPPPDHHVRVSLNGAQIAERLWNGITRNDIDTTGVWLTADAQQRFRFQFQPYTDPTVTGRVDRVLLGWIELDYTRSLAAPEDTLSVFVGGYSGATAFSIAELTRDDVAVYQVDDVWNAERIAPAIVAAGASREARFSVEVEAERPPRLLVRPEGALARPALIELDRVPSPLLRDRTAAAQMLVITHEDLVGPAAEFAAFRAARFPDRGTGVVDVIDVQDIFDEFSFGRRDPTAIRQFLQVAKERWSGGDPEDAPAYVLLLGDCHFDYRDVLREGAQNFVPTFEGYHDRSLVGSPYSPQFGSDDYFAYLDGETDAALDLFLGRLPARTANEAAVMVEKIISYETESARDPWRLRATLVADDRCQGPNLDLPLMYTHTAQTEALAAIALPSTIQRDKIYLVDYGEECIYDKKPAAAEALRLSMTNGTLLVNYTGHGSETQIADERTFELSGVASLRNEDRLFLFVTASCSVGKFDHSTPGLGEALVLHPGGGAIAVFAATAVAFSNGNAELNRTFLQAAFPEGRASGARPLGEAAVIGKLRMTSPRSINSRRYALLGDPSVALVSPRQEMELELSSVGSALGDSLPRGVRVELEGVIVDTSGAVRDDFDGPVEVEVYDSAVVVRREVAYNSVFYRVNYELPGAPIYRGETEAEAGRFTVSFFTPSALRTGERGPAAVFVYASDSDGDEEAGGARVTLSVPERAAPTSEDTRGPNLTLEFDGDSEALPAGSEWVATLTDSSGINITGLVGSRSVVARIEENGVLIRAEDVASRVAFGDDFRAGEISYSLPTDLTPGHRYELILEASDNVNNRSSVSVSFFLAGGGDAGFELASAFVFPNPSSGPAGFFGEINDEAEIEVQIFTASGRSIARLGPARLTPDRFANEGLDWSGRDADGDGLANGVYFFKLTARPVGGGDARTTIGRLAVSR